MKVKFDNKINNDGPLPKDTNLYLECPECKRLAIWEGYPSNPVLSTVTCKHCRFESMGSAFRKITKKKKKPSVKDQRLLLESHKAFHPGPMEPGTPISAVAHVLSQNKPLMGVLDEIEVGHLIIDSSVMKLIRKGQRLGLLSDDAGFYLLTDTGQKVLEEAREFGWLPDGAKK